MNKKTLSRQINQAINSDPHKKLIKRISLFGSFNSNKAKKNSDIDLLVEFASPVGFFTLVAIQNNLEKQTKRKIDLVTPQSLSKHFRREVVDNAVTIYE